MRNSKYTQTLTQTHKHTLSTVHHFINIPAAFSSIFSYLNCLDTALLRPSQFRSVIGWEDTEGRGQPKVSRSAHPQRDRGLDPAPPPSQFWSHAACLERQYGLSVFLRLYRWLIFQRLSFPPLSLCITRKNLCKNEEEIILQINRFISKQDIEPQ